MSINPYSAPPRDPQIVPGNRWHFFPKYLNDWWFVSAGGALSLILRLLEFLLSDESCLEQILILFRV